MLGFIDFYGHTTTYTHVIGGQWLNNVAIRHREPMNGAYIVLPFLGRLLSCSSGYHYNATMDSSCSPTEAVLDPRHRVQRYSLGGIPLFELRYTDGRWTLSNL